MGANRLFYPKSVHSEFLKQKRKVEEIKLDWFNKYLCVFILGVGGTLAYLIFCRVLRFRDRWLWKKNFPSKKHAHERSNPIVATKLIGDFAIFYNNSWSHKASFSEKVTFKWGIWRQVLPGEGRGGGVKKKQSPVVWLGLENQSTLQTVLFCLLLKLPRQLTIYAGTCNFIHILARSFGGECIFKFVPKAGNFTLICCTSRNIFAKRDA